MTDSRTDRFSRRLARGIEHLFPGYFALVMATGIVSLAAHLRGFAAIAWVLFGVNLVAYAVLTLLLLVRVLRYSGRILEDLRDHSRGPGFFTLVASTCVVGSVAREITTVASSSFCQVSTSLALAPNTPAQAQRGWDGVNA